MRATSAAALGSLLALAIAAPARGGQVHVLSGATGQASFVIEGVAGDELGSAMGNDIVPGGAVGFLLGAPGTNGGEGKVVVFDPANRTVSEEIDRADLEGPVERFGHAILNLGHIDGSSAVWWAISAPARRDSDLRPAVIVVREQGGAYRELYRVEGRPGSLFGWSLTFLQDLDGDDEPEFLVGAPAQNRGRRKETGAVFAYSGLTGRPLWSLRGRRAGEHLGFSSDPCHANGVEGEDLILGAPGDGARRPGQVVLSSFGGEVSRVIDAPDGAFHFGYQVACHPFIEQVPVMMVSAPTSGFRKPASGSFYFLAEDGTIVERFDGSRRNQLLGTNFASWPRRETLPFELVLVSSWERGALRGRGQVEFLEQPGWTSRERRRGSERRDSLGGALRPTYDLDGDDAFEFLLGEPQGRELWLPGPPED